MISTRRKKRRKGSLTPPASSPAPVPSASAPVLVQPRAPSPVHPPFPQVLVQPVFSPVSALGLGHSPYHRHVRYFLFCPSPWRGPSRSPTPVSPVPSVSKLPLPCLFCSMFGLSVLLPVCLVPLRFLPWATRGHPLGRGYDPVLPVSYFLVLWTGS